MCIYTYTHICTYIYIYTYMVAPPTGATHKAPQEVQAPTTSSKR